MAKIKCLVTLKEDNNFILNNQEFLGVKINNKINYKEQDKMVTIFIEDNRIVMKRVSTEYQIKLEFEENRKTNGQYFLNNDNLLLPLDIFTDKILISEKNIVLQYHLNESDFYFEINIEVIE